MKSNLLKNLSAIFLMGLMVSMTACGSTDNSGTSQAQSEAPIEESKKSSEVISDTAKDSTLESDSTSVADTGKVIDSIKPKAETVQIKIGASDNVANHYDIVAVGGTKLTSSQKKCTVSVDNEKVLKISGTTAIKMRAVGVGEANVTVTSKLDTTVSCTFKVIVNDAFFDLETSIYDPIDDLENDMPTEESGGRIRSNSSATAEYIVRNVASVNWYAETKIIVNSVASSEQWPKMGIFADTADYSSDNGTTNNRFYFFLNAEIGNTGDQWNKFGCCEVSNRDGWAWNDGIDNATARHNDNFYELSNILTYGSEVKLGLLKDGLNFHFYVNDVYVASATVLESLFSNLVTSENFITNVGFFEFNSDVTFFDYAVTTDETTLSEKLGAISATYINWAED